MTKLDEHMKQGIFYENLQDWSRAFKYWRKICLSSKITNETLEHLVKSAIRIKQPLLALIVIRRLNLKKNFKLQISNTDQLEQKLTNLAASRARIVAMDAFRKKQYSISRVNFSLLHSLVPDHPWAAKYVELTQGLEASFATKLQNRFSEPKQRFYITGCARSGTWLMASMLKCFPHISLETEEKPIGKFLTMTSDKPIHALKRQHDAWKYFDKIPEDIHVIHMVRHPYSVLTSKHLDKANYVSTERLIHEHTAYLQVLFNRKNLTVIKYEDLVLKPQSIQNLFEQILKITPIVPFDKFHSASKLPDIIQRGMNKLRPLDTKNINSWISNKSALAYLEASGVHTISIVKEFSNIHRYDLSFYDNEITKVRS